MQSKSIANRSLRFRSQLAKAEMRPLSLPTSTPLGFAWLGFAWRNQQTSSRCSEWVNRKLIESFSKVQPEKCWGKEGKKGTCEAQRE